MPSQDYTKLPLEETESAIDGIIKRWEEKGGTKLIETLELKDGSKFNVWLNPPRILAALLYAYGDTRTDFIIAKLLDLTHADYMNMMDYLEWGAGDELIQRVLDLLGTRRQHFLSNDAKPSSPSSTPSTQES